MTEKARAALNAAARARKEADPQKWIEANRRYQATYREKHREELKARQKKWREENPDKIREYINRYWEKKADEMAETLREAVSGEGNHDSKNTDCN